MADVNEVAESMGVDPVLAATGQDFLGNLGMQQTGLYSPYSQQSGRGSVYIPPDLQVSGASSIENVSRVLERLTISFDNIQRSIDKIASSTDNFTKGIIGLQREAQGRITTSQIPTYYAQARNPEQFPYAAGLSYQTYPHEAIFRAPAPATRTRLAERAGASFLGDVTQMSQWWRQNWYEPSFAEDPYMTYINARQRMGERATTAANFTGTIGAQLGTGLATTYGIGKLGQAAFGISAGKGLIGALGGPLGIADIGLGLALQSMGLPDVSISGMTSAAAESVYGATAGRFFGGIDMARDISRNTRFFTGQGASATGQGLGLGKAGRVVRGLQEMQSKDFVLNIKDYMGIFTEAGNQGLLSQVGNEEGMLRNVKEISKNLRLFMRINGDPDYRNSIKQMGDLFRMGVPIENLGSAAMNIQNFSRMAGLSTQQAGNFGLQGGGIFQQAGSSMGLGYQVGIMSRAGARLAVQSGAVLPGMLARFGGEEGMAQTVTEATGAFMGGPIGNLLLAGFLERKGGQFSVSPDILKQVTGGKMTFEEIINRSKGNLSTRGNIEEWYTRKQELQDQMNNMLGASGTPLLMMRLIETIMQRTGLGYRGAAQSMLGEQGGLAFTNMYNTRTMPNIMEAVTRQNQMQAVNSLQVARSREFIYNRAILGVKGFWERNVGSSIDRMSENLMQREQEQQDINSGIIREKGLGESWGSNFGRMFNAMSDREKGLITERMKRVKAGTDVYSLFAISPAGRVNQEQVEKAGNQLGSMFIGGGAALDRKIRMAAENRTPIRELLADINSTMRITGGMDAQTVNEAILNRAKDIYETAGEGSLFEVQYREGQRSSAEFAGILGRKTSTVGEIIRATELFKDRQKGKSLKFDIMKYAAPEVAGTQEDILKVIVPQEELKRMMRKVGIDTGEIPADVFSRQMRGEYNSSGEYVERVSGDKLYSVQQELQGKMDKVPDFIPDSEKNAFLLGAANIQAGNEEVARRMMVGIAGRNKKIDAGALYEAARKIGDFSVATQQVAELSSKMTGSDINVGLASNTMFGEIAKRVARGSITGDEYSKMLSITEDRIISPSEMKELNVIGGRDKIMGIYSSSNMNETQLKQADDLLKRISGPDYYKEIQGVIDTDKEATPTDKKQLETLVSIKSILEKTAMEKGYSATEGNYAPWTNVLPQSMDTSR